MGEKLILTTSWQPVRSSFLRALGVGQNGLGSQLFEHVFESFFVHSVDLKREYTKYYSVEYATLGDYIEIVYGRVLGESALEKEHIYLITNFPLIVDTNYEGNMLDAVLMCVEQLEGSSENPT